MEGSPRQYGAVSLGRLLSDADPVLVIQVGGGDLVQLAEQVVYPPSVRRRRRVEVPQPARPQAQAEVVPAIAAQCLVPFEAERPHVIDDDVQRRLARCIVREVERVLQDGVGDQGDGVAQLGQRDVE